MTGSINLAIDHPPECKIMDTPGSKVGRNTIERRRWYPLVGCAVGVYLVLLGWYHWDQLSIPLWRIPVIVSFVWMVLICVAAHLNRPTRSETPDLKVAVIIPSHNEDPDMLRIMLNSVESQTTPPFAVYFIENGETNGVAEQIFTTWAAQTSILRTRFIYRNEPGKRDAQGAAIAMETTADIIMTIDSDSKLTPNAIEEGLKPFTDPEVMSVAGLLVGLNYNSNLLTRIVNISVTSSFVNGRAAWSRLNSVAVNSGCLAFYRTWVVKKHLQYLLNQKVAGRKVRAGDDRVFTAFAALEGKTVFQQTCAAYTLLPKESGT